MNTGKTIFFDMDGTLLDTEKYYHKYWILAAKECGYTMTREMALSLRSLGRPYAPERINNWYQDENAYHTIRDKRIEMMEQALSQDGITLKTYAKETLAELKNRGHHLAITTATGPERTEAYLQEVGLYPYFDSIVCATMVEHGKPAPDIYLYACEQLKVRPEDAYVVEDAPNGILAGYRAGCHVIMVPDLTQPDEELDKLLYRKVENLKELLEIF